MTTNPDKFAREIAHALNDPEALPLYHSYAQKYSESFLRKLLMRVLSVPDNKIRRTRGALFTFLVTQQFGEKKELRDQDYERMEQEEYDDEEDNYRN